MLVGQSTSWIVDGRGFARPLPFPAVVPFLPLPLPMSKRHAAISAADGICVLCFERFAEERDEIFKAAFSRIDMDG